MGGAADDLKMLPFDPLTADDALWAAFFDRAEALYQELNPGEPMLPRHRRKEHAVSAAANPYSRTYTYLAMDGAKAAAMAYVIVETPKSPTYDSNKDQGNLHGLFVAPERRRGGIATRLLGHVLRGLAEREPQVAKLMAPTATESGRLFLEKKGAKLSLVHGENRLYLAGVDWAMVERWAAEGESRNPDTEIITVPEIPEADLADFARAYTETINQQPLGELDLRMEITPEQIRYGEKKAREQGKICTAIYTREAGGRVSGLTETAYMPELGHVVTQMLTGVRADYRGRGLGKLLKARMLLHIRKHWPGVKYVATGNADANAPMMAINNKLGFRKHRPVLLYTLKITPELAAG